MRRFHFLCLLILLTGSLAGCFPFSAMDAAFILVSLPIEAGTGKADLAGYTIGPVTTDEFQKRIQRAISASEGEVYLAGRAQWTGLKNVKQPGYRYLQSVAAITDTGIHFLWWNESEEHYTVLIGLPYQDIRSVALDDSGLGASIKLCHEDEELMIGDQTISIDRLTHFNFLKSGMFGDPEKTKRAFELLDIRIQPKTGLEHAPDPCESTQEPLPENPGFGEDDLLNPNQSIDEDSR